MRRGFEVTAFMVCSVAVWLIIWGLFEIGLIFARPVYLSDVVLANGLGLAVQEWARAAWRAFRSGYEFQPEKQ